MSLRVAELESLFTANIQPFEQGAQRVEATQRRLDGTSTQVSVDTNAAAAVQDLQRVESTVRGLPDGDMTVEADTSQASRALNDLSDEAGDAGRDAGAQAGEGLADELVAAIVSIPIAGAIIGAGVVAGKALFQGIQDGLSVEPGRDRLMAQAGLDPATTAILGRAAGEAYASNWGESVSANLDSARIAVQSGLLDPETTKRDAQDIISNLAGVSDLIEEETARVARSSGQLIKNDLAANAEEAFDIIVKGSQAGLNVSDDLLDTLDEYSTQFRSLGLDGPQALGLLRQAVQAGARDTDVAADALKEFAIRGKELDDSRGGYEKIGLDAEEMAEKVARGGDDATEALGEVLDALRELEDPVARDAAAVELFGTKAEDMQQALYNMDLSSAVDELGAVEGAASSALGALSDNTQNDIDTAQRNIEVAAQGIKGALASAFAPQIEGAATFVTENREAVVGFLLDIANGALDMGRGFVEGTAVASEATGEFVAGPLADMVDGVASILNGLDNIPGVQTGDAEQSMRDLAEEMRGADESADAFADTLRERLITNGIDPAQAKLNELGETLRTDARLNDTATRLASGIDAIGIAADGAQASLSGFDGSLDTSTSTGSMLDEQLRGVAEAMDEQARASRDAGEGSDELRTSLEESREALERQLEAMGLSEEEAKELADAYGLIPEDVVTNVTTSGVDGVLADLATIEEQIRYLTGDNTIRVARGPGGSGGLTFHDGGIAMPMAAGGIHGSPLAPIATMVPPGTLRVVGDRLDVDEAFIPLDRSPRSMAILAETMRRMGVMPMAAGGVHGKPTVIPQSITHQTEAPTIIENLYLSGDGAFEAEMDRRRARSTGGRRG